MYRIRFLATLTALAGLLAFLPTVHAGAQGMFCNNTSYEADGDPELEVELYSTGLQEFWTCDILHIVTNRSRVQKKQIFTVDYQAAGIYVGALAPLKSRLVDTSSWKNCVSINDGADFTRLAPQPAPRVHAATAPACGGGFPVLEEIKYFLDFGGSVKSLSSVLEERDEVTGETEELLASTTSFDLDATGQWWEYKLLVESSFENTVDLYLDGPWSRIVGAPIDLSLEPGAATEVLLRVPVGAAGDEPKEYSESLEFDDGREEFGAIPVSVIAPTDLGDRLRGDVDGDGMLTITDGMALAGYLFRGGAAPVCTDAADFDNDQTLDLTDAIALFHHLFLGTPGPEETTADCSVIRNDIELLITELIPSVPSESAISSEKPGLSKK